MKPVGKELMIKLYSYTHQWKIEWNWHVGSIYYTWLQLNVPSFGKWVFIRIAFTTEVPGSTSSRAHCLESHHKISVETFPPGLILSDELNHMVHVVITFHLVKDFLMRRTWLHIMTSIRVWLCSLILSWIYHVQGIHLI